MGRSGNEVTVLFLFVGIGRIFGVLEDFTLSLSGVQMSEEVTYLEIPKEPEIEGITFHKYTSQSEINEFKRINDRMLSEAYSVYTYHYFVDQNPDITYSVGDSIVQ